MIIDRPINPERHTLEPPEREHDRARANSKDDPLRPFTQAARGEYEVIDEMCEHQDGKVERWKLEEAMKAGQYGKTGCKINEHRALAYIMVNVGDTAHDQERS